MPRACRTWQEVIPDDPAPMTQTRLTAGCRDNLAASAESGWRGLRAGSDARPRGVRGRPPVPAAEERNCRRHQQSADSEDVQEDAKSQRGKDVPVHPSSRLTRFHQREDAEHASEDEPGRGDGRSRPLQCPGHGLPQ